MGGAQLTQARIASNPFVNPISLKVLYLLIVSVDTAKMARHYALLVKRAGPENAAAQSGSN
jgi:hypothetical protein